MLDKKMILNETEKVKHLLKLKGYCFDDVNYLELDCNRKKIQIEVETLQCRKNEIAKEIPKARRNNIDITALTFEGTEINTTLKDKKNTLQNILDKINDIHLEMPNIPHDNIVVGNDESDNIELRKWNEPKNFNFKVKDHVELGKNIDNNLDFEKAVKIAKTRFAIMKGNVAKLHRAIGQFMIDVHTNEHNYLEVNVPLIVNETALTGTGQYPKFKEDLFTINGDENLALIPTAEVPLTNLVANEMLNINDLPLKFVALTQCFRSEAGAYGRDTKGMIRQHQFEKVELVQIVEQKNADNTLLEILTNAEKILQLLDLPYRVVELCTGDLGFSANKTFDIEVWIPSQETYREISSCSNMTDFQARRMKTRYKDEEGEKLLVNTLNGSGLAVGRTLVAIMENYQQENGSINVPDVLIPYMHGVKNIN